MLFTILNTNTTHEVLVGINIMMVYSIYYIPYIVYVRVSNCSLVLSSTISQQSVTSLSIKDWLGRKPITNYYVQFCTVVQ